MIRLLQPLRGSKQRHRIGYTSPHETKTWVAGARFFHELAKPNDRDEDESNTGLKWSSKEVEERMQELAPTNIALYPRYVRNSQASSIRHLVDSFVNGRAEDKPLIDSQEVEGERVTSTKQDCALTTTVSGRITSIRLSGSKLVFLDIVEDQVKLQVSISYATLEPFGISLDEFKRQCRLVRRGDYICKTSIHNTLRLRQLTIQSHQEWTALPQ